MRIQLQDKYRGYYLKKSIYYITNMGKYNCEKCAKSFSQKSHYDKHLSRKKPVRNTKR